MAKGDAEYRELLTAIQSTPPPCNNDERFTEDFPSEWDLVNTRGICRTCPVLELCDAYATAAKPTAGFWAGKRRVARSGASKATETTP